MFNVPVEKMTKENWINLLTLGWDKGIVKVITEDNDNKYGTIGVACNIGENAFYFCDADEYEPFDYEDANAFAERIGKEKLIDMIATGLLGMQSDYKKSMTSYDKEYYGDIDPEYSYYFWYLTANI